MKLNKMMEKNRRAELRAICKFIDTADFEDLTTIIEEIRVCHDNIFVFSEEHKSLDRVTSVCLNGECIQLNLEKQ